MKTLTIALATCAFMPVAAMASPAAYSSAGSVAAMNDISPNFIAGQPCGCSGERFPKTATVHIGASPERVTYSVSRRAGGYIRGVDADTGKRWRVEISPSGGIRGQDLDGAAWAYSPRTHTYTNRSTGRTCAQTSVLHVCPV
jgi:hypothetical protein